MPFEKGHEKIGGREKGTPNKAPGPDKELEDALCRAKGKHRDVSLIESVCDRAYGDTPLAIAVMRKMLPDMRQVEVVRKYEGGYAEDTPAEACEKMDAATIGEKPSE